MTTNETITLARKNLGGAMESSARLCLKDALDYLESGHLVWAKSAAIRSLKYSVGILHADYQRAIR